MINTYEIEEATTTIELDDLLEAAASERSFKLDSSMSYKEQADFFINESQKNTNEEMYELVELLIAAEKRWFELEK